MALVLPGRGIGWLQLLRELKRAWESGDLMDVAGSLTFFGVLAIFPFLLFLVSLAALVIDPAQAELLVDELARVAPPEVTAILGARLHALGEGGSPELLTISALGAIWSASTGIAALIRALNRAYGVRESRPSWKVRGIALLTTLAAGILSVIATVAAVVAPAVASALGDWLGAWILWLRLPVAGLTIMLVWAMLYYFLPDVEQRFRFITPGSVVGVIVWLLASSGFSLYVQHFGSYEVNYGALGGVIVLLFWMWISSTVILLGAEINALLELHAPEGKRTGARTMEKAGGDAAKARLRPERTACRAGIPGGQVAMRRMRPIPGAVAVLLVALAFLLGRWTR